MAIRDQYSEREIELAVLAWQCVEPEVKINWAKFAQVAGYSSDKSARANFSSIKKKLTNGVATDNGEGASSTSTPAKKTPRKRATGGSAKRRLAKGADDFDDEETPTKKVKGGVKAAKVKTEGAVKDEELASLENLKAEREME